MVRDRKPRRVASAKQKDDWLLTPWTSSTVMSGVAWFLSSDCDGHLLVFLGKSFLLSEFPFFICAMDALDTMI